MALWHQQTVLARFGKFALRSDDLDEILTEAYRLVRDVLCTDLAKVMELQQDGEALLVRAGVGWNPGVVGEVVVKASEGHALKAGEAMVSPDVGTKTRFRYLPFLTENEIEALASVIILRAKNKPPLGILQIDSREPREFTNDDNAYLSGYDNLPAAAMDCPRVLGEVRDGDAQLRVSAERQRAALETGLIGFFEWNTPTRTITADKHFAGFYGLNPTAAAAGVPLADLIAHVHPDDRAVVEANVGAALASTANYAEEFRVVHAGGEVRWVHLRGHCSEQAGGLPLRCTGTAVDVTASKAAEAALRRANEALEARVAERTRELVEANAKLRAEAEERERVEEQLRQSHKMEAVGQLTGGIAHDFNNLLMGISGSLELMRAHAAQGGTADLGRYIDTALASADRAAALTHRLLAFSRRQTLDPKPIDVDRLVASMDDLVRRTVGPGIRVETRLAGEPWSALCDPNQLESALLNLVINARDAMPEGGELVVEAANAVVPDRHGASRDMPSEDVPPGEYVVLSVADTGTGMIPDVIARAFDPFFTTKPLGQGTGLGLSMIYGFVQQSGGYVRLRSAPGQGTAATIYLPRHLGTAVPEAAVKAATRPSAAKEAAVVMVVEDESAVRMVITDVLSGLGYAVLEADNGRSGLGILESLAHIDLLVTDVGLPGGMNGRQLADAARQLRPDLKVLFVTGYAEGAVIGNRLLGESMEIMIKPFAVDALAARVQGIIGS